jgi:molybdenum cofactor synthesis domain-containing protein
VDQFRIGILTVSDTRTEETDLSGPAAAVALEEIGFTNLERRICQDDLSQIQAAILELSKRCNAVFTTGGTGFSPRDVTPDATAPLLDRQADSLTELLRLKGQEKTPLSYLSRGVAGMIGRVIVVNLPGSPTGARDGIAALAHLLPLILEALTAS